MTDNEWKPIGDAGMAVRQMELTAYSPDGPCSQQTYLLKWDKTPRMITLSVEEAQDLAMYILSSLEANDGRD